MCIQGDSDCLVNRLVKVLCFWCFFELRLKTIKTTFILDEKKRTDK